MFKILEGGFIPTLGSEKSACVDLYAREACSIGAGETKIIGMGIALTDEMIESLAHEWVFEMYHFFGISLDAERGIELFTKKHHFKLWLRSSRGKEGLILPNGAGIIDIDYRDEIKLIVQNPMSLLLENYFVNAGDKIAQIELCRNETNLLGYKTDAVRTGGLGSTGK